MDVRGVNFREERTNVRRGRTCEIATMRNLPPLSPFLERFFSYVEPCLLDRVRKLQS